MKQVAALVLTGYGLNCDYETDFSLKMAGAESHRIHFNDLIRTKKGAKGISLEKFHILVIGGGFTWADDHGAGVLMATKLKNHLGGVIESFINSGKLVLGICNGFQALVNLGLVPRFNGKLWERRAALTYNDSGNFIDCWVRLKINPQSPCIFTRGLDKIELPVRHGEGKFYASNKDVKELIASNQIVMRYSDEDGNQANGRWPLNPNGSLEDIAGICDPTGRIFGLMPHPEAYNHPTNHPDWMKNQGLINERKKSFLSQEGEGIRIFRNAVDYIRNSL